MSISAHLNNDPWIDYDAIAAKQSDLKDKDEVRFLVIGGGHAALSFAYRMCDVEGYIYLPVLEETGYVPKHRYSYGAEIRPKHTDITFTVQAQFVFASSGPFFVPRIPRPPGFDLQNNYVFHVFRWSYKCTGGPRENQNMTLLKDKTVVVVGTGATAAQCSAESQSGPSISTFFNMRENFNHFITNDPVPVDISERRLDRHTLILCRFLNTNSHRESGRQQGVGRGIEAWYLGWCRRPTFYDHYLATFNQSNVTLIDTNGRGLESYTSSGIVAGVVGYKVVILVLATGFSPSRAQDKDLEDSLGAPIIGRNEKWAAPDVGTVFSIITVKLPNPFLPDGTASPNLSSAYDLAARLSADLIKSTMMKRDNPPKLTIEPKKEAKSPRRDSQNLRKAPWGEEIAKYQLMVESLQRENRLDSFEIAS
ncbi:uncharacterized protein BDW43DRAFT_296607 [Aspergillus alliaceus]|uniref:uncharacterized protein n=1 Tax=Petromyces alliaceus TaxID=209559 RepID=UPI0012A3B787|nr:uncharacterized protein BDW43DRAFT_296607 [Aspergillus alliaceus]KAB8238314.1 hypothetical protein BDW43DRAFT_296607 [Aspergillus alliaceus]